MGFCYKKAKYSTVGCPLFFSFEFCNKFLTVNSTVTVPMVKLDAMSQQIDALCQLHNCLNTAFECLTVFLSDISKLYQATVY